MKSYLVLLYYFLGVTIVNLFEQAVSKNRLAKRVFICQYNVYLFEVFLVAFSGQAADLFIKYAWQNERVVHLFCFSRDAILFKIFHRVICTAKTLRLVHIDDARISAETERQRQHLQITHKI